MPTVKEYIQAIEESHGLVTQAAKKLGVDRSAIYKARDRHPAIKQALEDSREQTTDIAESKLYQQINEGNITAIIFYLKTQGKNRGYIERQERHYTGNLNLTELSDEELAKIAKGETP
jgi:hypothetical protein